MAELQITYEELRRHIARFIGVGREESDFSGDDARLADVDDIMLSGLRSFYWPVIDTKEGVCHRWSFLDVDGTLDLVANQHTYLLPGNYSRLKESFTYPIGSEKRPIATVPYRHLRVLRSTENATGDPIYCAVQTRENVDNGRTIYEVTFYPTPTESTTLSYSIEIEPQIATGNFDDVYPLGGAMHSETIIEACLAAAERVLNPEAGPGYHFEKFQQLLIASVEIDKNTVDQDAVTETWPVDGIGTTPDTLEVSKLYLEQVIGLKLGYGSNKHSWTHGQAVEVDLVIRSALRATYYPVIDEKENAIYRWSFLEQDVVLGLVVGQYDYALPDNFSSLKVGFTFSNGSGEKPIAVISNEHIRALRANENKSGTPLYCSIHSAYSPDGNRSRSTVSFYPTPAEAEDISGRIIIEPAMLTDQYSIPVGGVLLAETLLEACNLQCDKLRGLPASDDLFRQRLGLAVEFDKQAAAADGATEVKSWPVDGVGTTQDSLEVSKFYLQQVIGRHRGFGANPRSWTHSESIEVDLALRDALRSVYWPVLDEKTGENYRWSFLEQELSIQLIASQSDYLLPDNFTSLRTGFTFPAGTSNRPIAIVPQAHLRTLQAKGYATGVPLYCSIKESTQGGDRSKKVVSFYPTPDADSASIVSCRILIEPTMLPEAHSRPVGGVLLAQVILEACLMAAEKSADPKSGGGIHAETFRKYLLAAIDADRRVMEAEEANELASWPLDGETGGISSLEVTKSQLERLIGRAIFNNPNPKTWTHGQASTVAEVLRTGLRKFYQPQVLPNERDTWQWSFLSPVHLMDIQSGVFAYDLPLDFSMVRGGITYSDGTGIMYPPIRLVSEEQVRQQLQATGNTARPFVAAIRVKNSNENTGTRYEFLLAPIPSEDRQIAIPYAINPEQLGTDQALPMGGQPHAQTVIEACLAASEIHLGSGNSHQQEFLTCLQASISHDRMLSSPHTLGYNRDNSDSYHHDLPYVERFNRGDSMTTYNGTVYWD
jgi:hypothetical protein